MNSIFRVLIQHFLLFLFIFFLTPAYSQNFNSLKINIFSQKNGKGLEMDQRILSKALNQLGCVVYERDIKQKKARSDPEVDVNIVFQDIDIHPDWIASAKQNWFVPNPECFDQKLSKLDKIDLILCRTRFVETIFRDLNRKTFFLGFTSLDYYDEQVPKTYETCFHLPGGSPWKGTAAIVEVWKKYISLPSLVVLIQYTADNIGAPVPVVQKNVGWISRRIPEANLRHIYNNCGIHLCPSETEGFGHYIMEGMSTKAVIITTDAPPMNEFITDKRCLVPFKKMQPYFLGIKYFVDSQELAKTVQNIAALSQEELEELGERNRAIYLEKQQEFYHNLTELLQSVN